MAILRKTQVQGDLNVDQKLIVTGSTALKGGLTVDGTTTVNGDLKVTGDVIYTGTENLRVKDKNIELNVDGTGSAASDRAGANEAGITIRATSADGQNEDVKFYYDPNEGAKGAWKSNVPFGVTIEGSVANAEYATTAGTANKVANKLINGDGIKAFEFNGSGSVPVEVAVDENYIKGVKVNNATTADTATTADKVKAALTAKSGSGIVMAKAYDGSEAVEVSVDDEHVKAVAKAVKVDNATTADTATKVGKSLKLDTRTTPELTFAESGATDFDGSAERTIKLDLSAYAKTADVSESLADKADQSALTALETKVNNNTTAIGNKVDKVNGKGLSSNDYTTAEKNKLKGIAEGAQVNVIETVKVNGTALTSVDKAVDITVPAATVTGVHSDDKFLTLTNKLLSVVASLKYDTGTKKIQLIGKDGTAVSEIDAAAFIKDGMLSNAELVENPDDQHVGTYFKLTWNTDAGKDVMYVDVTSLIDVYTAKENGGLLLDGHAFSVDTTKIATVDSVNAVNTKVDGLKINGKRVAENTVLTGEDIKVDGAENAQTIKAAIASASISGVQSIGGKTGAIGLVSGSTNGSVNLTISNSNELKADIVGLKSAAYETADTFVKVNDISGAVTKTADSGKFITSVTTAGGKVTTVESAQVQAAQVGYTKPAAAPTGNTVEKAIYDIQSELESLGGGAGSISSQIDAKINDLNSEVANTASNAEDTATTQIKVAVSESAGKLSKVEVFAPTFALPSDITSAVSTAKSELVGTAGTPNTIANAEDLASKAQTTADSCVKKAGDTMTGLLTTAAAGIKFGHCTVNYNSADAALEFVFA